MAKKTFIRHLEFYGYPDQNGYSSYVNGGGTDLSEIIKELEEQEEKDKEHDSEIADLEGDKANKTDLEALSAKVETAIEAQSMINSAFSESMADVVDNIESLQDDVDGLVANVEILSGNIDTINDSISGISDTIDNLLDFAEDTKGEISGLSDSIEDLNEKLSKKLDSDEAEEIYAKKSEVYSRAEADETFLKEHQDISNLATKEEVEELREEVAAIVLDDFVTKEELEAFSGEVNTFKETTNEHLGAVDESVENIERNVQAISGDVDTLKENVSGLVEEIDKKLDKTEFISYVNETDDKILTLDEKKADKTTLNAVSGAVSSLTQSLEDERIARENADNELDGKITVVDGKIEAVDDRVDSVSGNIDSLRDDLNQEIQDRISGDATLIGSTSDTASYDTIWGAKRYAEAKDSYTLSEAKTYTDDRYSSVQTYIDNKIDNINTDVAKKADKTYVDALVDERVQGLNDDLSARISGETALREQGDSNLASAIEALRDEIVSSADTKEIYKRINVITTYSGDTPEEYIDSGNGILDVLHREFHELEEEIGVVVNPTLVRTNQYESAFGTYNISNTGELPSEQTIFSIGIGTSDEDRKNAIEVRKDGTVMMWIEGEFMSINDLLSMLAHETYN
jgi:predicted  nucleic acid-binding Zn-ribbon protein